MNKLESQAVAAVSTLPLAEETPAGYAAFLVEIKSQIRQRQFQALRSVNCELLDLYWWLGENICRRQATQGWGRAVVENLARDLQAEFPGRNGFSAQNLWLMRQFFQEYSQKPKLQPLVREISWAKNLVVLARCKDDLAREFYLRATARFGWTKNVLQHQIDNQSYAQYLNGQTNFDAAVPDNIKAQALLAVKDHYTFDFLGLAEEHSERELEQALVRNCLPVTGTSCPAPSRSPHVCRLGRETRRMKKMRVWNKAGKPMPSNVPTRSRQRGFTLVELIMVIVVMGIIAGMVSVFMKSPIDAYVASGRRAALTDVADTVVRRIARDIQRALPNSIRTPTTTPTNLCVEFIPTKTGGRYRADDTAAGLSFTTADGSFNMLGSNTLFAGNTIPRDSIPADQQIANGDVIVVYNLGIPDSDAYQLTARVNTARVTAFAPSGTASSPETIISIVSTLAPNGDILFPLASGSNRFHVVPSGENVVSYVCDLTTRQMFRTVSTFANEPTDSCNSSGTLQTGSSRSVLASNISGCSFDYTGSDLHRNALISMRLQLTDNSGESVTLQHEVHVSNTP